MPESIAAHLWLELNGGIRPELGDRSEADAFARLAEPGQQWCDAKHLPAGAPGSCHHLVPRGPFGERYMQCSYCQRKEVDLRVAGEGFARVAREARA